MSTLRCAVGLLVLAGAVVPASARENKLPADALEILQKAETVELYSIRPAIFKVPPKDGFRERQVLGQTTVKDKATRAKLVAALLKGVEDGRGKGDGWAFPRHGLRATHKGKSVEMLISFENQGLRAWVGDKATTIPITRAGESLFDKVLKAAGVPLPKR